MTRNTYLLGAIALALVLAAFIWWLAAPAAKMKPDLGGPNLDSLPTTALPGSGSSTAQGPSAAVPTASPQAELKVPPTNLSSATDALPGSAVGVGVTTVSKVSTSSPNTQDGMIDLDKTQRMIRDYRTLMGENPVGTNFEIMKAVMGGNPRQATVGPGEGQQLNAKGELVDRWGTPYFFHQLSGTHMEIHSAGPDKIMGTDDDLILK